MFMRIVLGAVIVLFLVLWARAVLDIFRRRVDLSVGGKAAWTIGMLVVPFIGLLVYTMLRPADSQIAQRRRA
jgi:Phospholipase_D-nuclease N-terminal